MVDATIFGVRSFVVFRRTHVGYKLSCDKQGGLLLPLLIPNIPWKYMSMDFILLDMHQGHNAILAVICDILTKMVHLAPTAMHVGA